MLVVSVPDADEGSPLQGVPGVESSAEDSVGGGVEGDGKGGKPVHDPRPPCRWEMQTGGTRLHLGRLVPSEEDAGSEASERERWERWEREEERRVQAKELVGKASRRWTHAGQLATSAVWAPSMAVIAASEQRET